MNNENRIKSILKSKLNLPIKSSRNAVIYTRVSTKEQAENNGSLETQIKGCRQYCHKENLNIVAEIGGTYESAKTDERKEFNKVIDFVKNKKNNVKYLVVHSFDRFSRTGGQGIAIAQDLMTNHNVLVISATQAADLSTPEGDLQMSLLLVISKFDNDLRKKKVIDGMRNKLRNGIYVHKPPYGYELSKIGENKVPVPNEKARFIKMAFELKETGLNNISILNRINMLGANLNLKRLGDLFTSPFYCGYIKGSLLGEDIVKGIHKPLISVETYERVNHTKIKYYKDCLKENSLFPLKGFIKCGKCNKNWTAYTNNKKHKSYYKCNTQGCKCNRSSELMHKDFITYLSQFRLHKDLIKPLASQLLFTFRNLNESNYNRRQEIERRKAVLSNELNIISHRFATGKINEDIHKSSNELISGQLIELEAELRKVDVKISNPNKFVDFALKLSQDLNKIWDSGNNQIKQAIQKLVFPTGISFDTATMNYRTNSVNGLFASIAGLARVLGENEKGFSGENPNLSALVVPTRIELVSKV